MKINKHILVTLLGCFLPLFFLFFAPLLGINDNYAFVILIVIMFAVHINTPMKHTNKLNSDYNLKK